MIIIELGPLLEAAYAPFVRSASPVARRPSF